MQNKKILSVSELQRLADLNDIKEYHKQDKREKRQFLSKFCNDRAFLKKHTVSNRLVIPYQTESNIDIDKVLIYIDTLTDIDKITLVVLFKAVVKKLLPFKSLKNLIDLIKSVN